MNRAKSLQILRNGMYTCYNVALRTEYKPANTEYKIYTVYLNFKVFKHDFVRKFSQIMNRAKSSQILKEGNVCTVYVHDMIQCWLRGLRRGIYNDFGSGLTDMLP